MKKTINVEKIEGRVYQHDLAIKDVKNEKSKNFGKNFISGTLDVAVDDEGLNVVSVHYTYVPETTNSGSKNSTFSNLKKIIEEGKAWITDGKEEATKVKIDTALALNDFYDQNREEFVSVKRNEGGFVNIVNALCEEGIDRHKFETDMLITSVKRIEPEENPENAHLILKGAVFNYKNDILPVDFVVRNPIGINHFEGLNISSNTPVFTKVWGEINSTTVKIRKEELSAFGEPAISYTEKKTKEWTVTGTSPDVYMYGDENILTGEEVTKALQDREVMLAERKKQSEEWRANQTASNLNSFASGNAMNAPTPPANASGFSF